VPEGLVFSGGECVWSTGAPPNGITGFAGFNYDNILVVHQENITKAQAEELNIRDGCCFGPVFVKDGELNTLVYDMDTTYNARTAIGQRADGTIIFLCIDGRQAGSMGATYADAMELMKKLGAVNACNLDGGASTVMTRRDASGKVIQCGSYALIQASPRRMPTFFMVRPTETED
jgi:exopolysaccharide biosynthesis protein